MRYLPFTCRNGWLYLPLLGKHLARKTREFPAAAGKFNRIERLFDKQFYMRNSCKIFHDWFAKLQAFYSQKAPQLQIKLYANASKLPGNAHTIPAIVGKCTCNYRQPAITSRLNSPENFRELSLHPAGEVSRNLYVSLRAVACILCEVLATYKLVN